MKNYGELIIDTGSGTIEHTIKAMETGLLNVTGWRRNLELEGNVAPRMDSTLYCFSCTATNLRPADLWLSTSSGGHSLRVTNIVPLPSRPERLTYDEYNAILEDFAKRVVEPCGATGKLSISTIRLEDLLGTHAAQCLHDFARCANKDTGSAHPDDQALWHSFIISAYRDSLQKKKNGLSAPLLARWLNEDAGFPESIASELAVDYENSLALLHHYESAA